MAAGTRDQARVAYASPARRSTWRIGPLLLAVVLCTHGDEGTRTEHCTEHSDCDSALFCNSEGSCDTCSECVHPHDSIDGVCTCNLPVIPLWAGSIVAKAPLRACAKRYYLAADATCKAGDLPMVWESSSAAHAVDPATAQVQEGEVPPSGTLAADAVARGIPVVYRRTALRAANSSLHLWPALRWDHAALQQRLRGVKLKNTSVAWQGMQTVHSPDAEAPLAGYVQLHRQQARTSIDGEEMVRRMREADIEQPRAATVHLGDVPPSLLQAPCQHGHPAKHGHPATHGSHRALPGQDMEPGMQQLFLSDEDVAERLQHVWLSTKGHPHVMGMAVAGMLGLCQGCAVCIHVHAVVSLFCHLGAKTHTHFDSDHNVRCSPRRPRGRVSLNASC